MEHDDLKSSKLGNSSNRIRTKMFTLFMFTFAKRRIRPPKSYKDLSNINHVGSVSDSLGRLAAASQCMASVYDGGGVAVNGLSFRVNWIYTKKTVCVCASVCTCMRARMCVCARTCACGHVYASIRTYMHLYTYIYCTNVCTGVCFCLCLRRCRLYGARIFMTPFSCKLDVTRRGRLAWTCEGMHWVGGGGEGACRQADEDLAEHFVCRFESAESLATRCPQQKETEGHRMA